MKKLIILLIIFLSGFYIQSISAEIKIFNKFDDEHYFGIHGGYTYNFGDSVIFFGDLSKYVDSIPRPYLFIFDKNKYEISKIKIDYVNQPSIVESITLASCIKDKNGDLWLGLSHGDLFKLSGTEFTSYDSLLKVNSIKEINSIAFDDDGNLYIHSNTKLFRWDGNICEKLADAESDPYFRPFWGGGNTFFKIKNKIYFRNFHGTISYYDITNRIIDTVSLYHYFNTNKYHIYSQFIFFEESVYFTYAYDEVLHFGRYDGENFTNLDYYFDLINEGKPMKYIVNLAFDESKNLYIKILIPYGEGTKRDSIFVIDKDLKVTRIGYRHLLTKNEISFNDAYVFPNGEVYLPNSNLGFLVITNPTSVESPTNWLFMNRLYPNPARDRFSIDFGVEPVNLGSMKVEIYDYLGRSGGEIYPEIVYDSSTGKGTMKCEAGNFPKGMYIVVLSNGKYNRTMMLFLN